MADGVVDLSKIAAKYQDETHPTDEQLLAMALRNLGERIGALETEMQALDTNVAHIAGALEAIIETAMAKSGG